MAQTGNDVVVVTAIELTGVGLLALLASANDNLGGIVVILMIGFLIAWFLLNTSSLQNELQKIGLYSPTKAKLLGF